MKDWRDNEFQEFLEQDIGTAARKTFRNNGKEERRWDSIRLKLNGSGVLRPGYLLQKRLKIVALYATRASNLGRMIVSILTALGAQSVGTITSRLTRKKLKPNN